MQNTSKRRLLTVPQTADLEEIPFTTSSIRQLIFNEHQNGLAESGAVIRVGRKVLIDPDALLEWVVTQGNGGRPVEKIKKPIELRLNDATRDYLQKAAEVRGVSVQKLAARLIEAGLKEAV